MSSGQYFGPRFGAQCPERGREEAGCRRVLASLYWEGPSELPPEDKKLYKELAFDEAGVMEGLAWLNAQKSENDWTELRISWKDRP